MKKVKRFLKILSGLVLIVFVIVYSLFYYYTQPKSDNDIHSKFSDQRIKPTITYKIFKNLTFRELSIISDESLPTIVFVHGTIGSSIDFLAYMKDSSLSKKANFLSYDRVGYNYNDKNNVQESIAFERDLLQSITKDLAKNKTILVGYSYGGPIVLADFNKYKSLVLLAPAVYSEVEPMPWLVNIYKWKLTRWLVPPIWQKASKEKLSHQKDLKNFETEWSKNPNEIISIHGKEDVIVPYSNSEYLLSQFNKNQFKLITIPKAGHSLVWTEFNFIKEQLIKLLN
jgi:uncharacterized protein